MQRAVALGQGAMAALMPVGVEVADEICALATLQTGGLVCQVANYNSSKQSVVSGAAKAIDAAIDIAKNQKKVRRAVLLDVSAPFHCALMAPAAEELATRLDLTKDNIQAPTVPVVWNVEGESKLKDSTQICESLVRQVVSPVRWSQSIDHSVAQGTTSFVELGFGGVLTGLIKQHAPKADVVSCGTAEQVAAFLKELE